MSGKMPTFLDLKEATSADLKRVYKLNDRQLEVAVRRHSSDIKTPEGRRDFYESVYNNKRKS